MKCWARAFLLFSAAAISPAMLTFEVAFAESGKSEIVVDSIAELTSDDVLAHPDWFLSPVEETAIRQHVDGIVSDAKAATDLTCSATNEMCCSLDPNTDPETLVKLEAALKEADADVVAKKNTLDAAHAVRTAFLLETDTGNSMNRYLIAHAEFLRVSNQKLMPRPTAGKQAAARKADAVAKAAILPNAENAYNEVTGPVLTAQTALAKAKTMRDIIAAQVAAAKMPPKKTPSECDPSYEEEPSIVFEPIVVPSTTAHVTPNQDTVPTVTTEIVEYPNFQYLGASIWETVSGRL